jgi:hypothetical protein
LASLTSKPGSHESRVNRQEQKHSLTFHYGNARHTKYWQPQAAWVWQLQHTQHKLAARPLQATAWFSRQHAVLQQLTATQTRLLVRSTAAVTTRDKWQSQMLQHWCNQNAELQQRTAAAVKYYAAAEDCCAKTTKVDYGRHLSKQRKKPAHGMRCATMHDCRNMATSIVPQQQHHGSMHNEALVTCTEHIQHRAGSQHKHAGLSTSNLRSRQTDF